MDLTPWLRTSTFSSETTELWHQRMKSIGILSKTIINSLQELESCLATTSVGAEETHPCTLPLNMDAPNASRSFSSRIMG